MEVLKQPEGPKPSLAVGDDQISLATNPKYLELEVDQCLNWEQHVLLIAK